MSILRGLLFAELVALVLGAGVQKLDANLAAEENEYATVLASNSCAPWDGPAVAIAFYTTPTRCGQAKSARLSISFWRGLPLKEGQKYEFSGGASAGVATLCFEEGRCESAETGSVWIEGIEQRKSIAGHYEFIFKKAGHITGKFRAAWCPLPVICR